MPDREPEPWENGAAGPFLRIEGCPIEVWALGKDRFAVRGPGHEQLVTGLEEAQQAAQNEVEGVRAAPALYK